MEKKKLVTKENIWHKLLSDEENSFLLKIIDKCSGGTSKASVFMHVFIEAVISYSCSFLTSLHINLLDG